MATFWRISYSRSIGTVAFGATVLTTSDDPVEARKSLRSRYRFLRKNIRPASEQEIAVWRKRRADDLAELMAMQED